MLTRPQLALGLLAFLLWTPAKSADCPEAKALDISIMIQNFKGPLVSAKLAEQMAIAFFQTHYPDNLFQAKLPASTTDLGDRWSVTFDNAVYDPAIDFTKRLQVNRMGIEICKSNGAIVRIM
jgi:hypothetical protein